MATVEWGVEVGDGELFGDSIVSSDDVILEEWDIVLVEDNTAWGEG